MGRFVCILCLLSCCAEILVMGSCTDPQLHYKLLFMLSFQRTLSQVTLTILNNSLGLDWGGWICGQTRTTHPDVPLLQILMWTWRLLLQLANGYTSQPRVHSLSHTSPLHFSKATISMLWLCLSFSLPLQQACLWQRHRDGSLLLPGCTDSKVRMGGTNRGGCVTPSTGQRLLLSDSYIWKSESTWVIMWGHWRSPFPQRGGSLFTLRNVSPQFWYPNPQVPGSGQVKQAAGLLQNWSLTEFSLQLSS